MNLAAAKWIMVLPCSRGGLDGSLKLTLIAMWTEGTWSLEAAQTVNPRRAKLAAATGQNIETIKDHLQRLARLCWIRRTVAGWELAWMTPWPGPGVQVPAGIQVPGDSSPRPPGGSSPRDGGSSPRGGDSSPRPSLTSSSSSPRAETSTATEPEPLTLVPLAVVHRDTKPDKIAEAIDRILAAQAAAIDEAIAVHGASPGCRLPGSGTADRRAIEKLIRERLTKDKRTEADCMHVLETYRRDWIADPIALQKGWTRTTPWRPKFFGDRLGADLSTPHRSRRVEPAKRPSTAPASSDEFIEMRREWEARQGSE